MKRIICLAMGIFFLCSFAISCSKQETYATMVTVYTEQDSSPFVNPDMGWVFYDIAFPPHQMADESVFEEYYRQLKGKVNTVAVMSSWGYIETSEGVYDWQYVDRSVSFWQSKGMDVQLRIATDALLYSNVSRGCPDYLFRAPYNVPFQTKTESGIEVVYPDYSNPVYQEKLTDFLNEMSARYAENPVVKVVDLRGYGLWGEWHSGYEYDTMEKRRSVLKELIDIWYEAFEGTGKLLNLSASWDPILLEEDLQAETPLEFMQNSAFDYAMTKPLIAIRRDGVGGAVYDGDSGRFDKNFIEMFNASGKRLPFTAEYIGSGSGDNAFLDMYEESLEYCPTFSSIFGHDRYGLTNFLNHPDLINRGNLELGYRFIVDSFTYPSAIRKGGTMRLSFSLKNLAYGIAYKDYVFEIEIYSLSGEKLYSYPVESVQTSEIVRDKDYIYFAEMLLPDSLQEDTYQLAVSMYDSATQKKIRLGMDQDIDFYDYRIGEFTIGGNAVCPQFSYRTADCGNVTGEKKVDINARPGEKVQILYEIVSTERNAYGFAEKFTVEMDGEIYEIGGENGYTGQLVIECRKNCGQLTIQGGSGVINIPEIKIIEGGK